MAQMSAQWRQDHIDLENAARPVTQFLAHFGLEAENDHEWSEAYLALVREGDQPQLEISVMGHEESEGHTWYALECAFKRATHPGRRIFWRCRLRLKHIREAVHDPVKGWLAPEEYAKHFGETPFARKGSWWGTTRRLASWLQSLACCVNNA